MEEKILYLITRKLSNEATPEELQELDYYINSHPEAGSYLDMIENIWNQQHKELTEEEDLESSYRKHISRHSPVFEENTFPAETSIPLYRKLWSNRYVLAAACMIFLLASIFLYTSQSAKPAVPNLGMEVLTAKKSRKEFVLPDGTKVWLNGSSTLKYDNDMNKAENRLVYLSGEAFF